MPKVSVILPVYNCEDFIRYALDSVLSQTFREFEIVVIDDGSNVETKAVLKEYKNKVIYRRQENRGQASAINAGISLSSGEYIALLDADDECHPERLYIQSHYLDIHPNIGLVYSDRYQIDKDGKIVCVIKSKALDELHLLQHNYIPRSSVMLRRSCLDKVGFFDEENTGNDDWDMWVRFSEKYDMHYIPQPLIKYRIHDKNISIIRPRRLNYNRYTRLRMLEKAYQRHDKPMWFTFILIRAKLEWFIGKNGIIDKICPKFWSITDRIFSFIERIFLSKVANNLLRINHSGKSVRLP